MASRRRILLLALPLALLASACGGQTGSGAAADGRLRVVTTVSPLTSIVANVVGDRAVVTGIVPEGTNSHTFEPPPSAARVLAEADVVFVNGLKLEDPTRDLATRSRKAGAETVELGDLALAEADHIYDFSFPREGGKPNPHLWTSPPLVRRYAEIVRDTMIRRDPEGAATYRANAAAYASRVDAFDAALRTATATLPPERRKLLTYHDAYAYFAREYGWTVIGAVQVSDFEDPTPRELTRLIDQVRAEDVPAIFGSEVFPSPVLERIGTEAGVRYVDNLRDDDLPGRPGAPEHTLLALLQLDFVTMIRSLGGDPAALGAVDVSDVVPDKAAYPQ